MTDSAENREAGPHSKSNDPLCDTAPGDAESHTPADLETILNGLPAARPVLEALGEDVLVVDPELNILWASKGVEGIRTDGEKCYVLYASADRPCFGCPALLACATERTHVCEVGQAIGDNDVWYEVTAVPLRSAGQPVSHILMIRHEVTHRHRLQRQLLSSGRLSLVGELIAGVAHELNNPLAAVMGFSELLLASNPPGHLREALELMHRETLRCRRIVKNLLDFARSSPFERTPLIVNDLLDATLELKSYQLRVDDVVVQREFSRSVALVHGDGQRLQQVFLNLFNNAHDAMRRSDRPGELTVRTFNDGSGVVIQVADTGSGIAPECIERIFEPFYTSKGPGEGTGLGLSLSGGIIAEHGGSIDVESTVGMGTTFTIRLPKCPGRATDDRAAEPRGQVTSMQSSLRVLFVDDEPAMLELIVSLLALDGHEVETCCDAREALRRVETDPDRYDLIIADVRMPGLTGAQLYQRVTQLRPRTSAAFIFTTGDTASVETRELLELTGRAVLEKPFAIRDLHAAIREATSGPRAPVARDNSLELDAD